MSISSIIDRRVRKPSILFRDVRTIHRLITKPEVVTNFGVKIQVDESLPQVIKKNLYAGTYELEEATVLSSCLTKNDVVVELGGGLGFISSLCCKLIPSKSVHVYEANPQLKPQLEQTFKLNNVAPNLSFLALDSETCTRDFYLADVFWASSFVKPQDGGDQKIDVEVRKFSDELNRLTPRPNFLILDIEGGELDFCKNVDLSGITKILMEVHGHVLSQAQIAELESILNSLGFQKDQGLSDSNVWLLAR